MINTMTRWVRERRPAKHGSAESRPIHVFCWSSLRSAYGAQSKHRLRVFALVLLCAFLCASAPSMKRLFLVKSCCAIAVVPPPTATSRGLCRTAASSVSLLFALPSRRGSLAAQYGTRRGRGAISGRLSRAATHTDRAPAPGSRLAPLGLVVDHAAAAVRGGERKSFGPATARGAPTQATRQRHNGHLPSPPRRRARAPTCATRRGPRSVPRQILQPACTSNARSSRGTRFRDRAFALRSPELYSYGTSPKNALARAASPPNRAGCRGPAETSARQPGRPQGASSAAESPIASTRAWPATVHPPSAVVQLREHRLHRGHRRRQGGRHRRREAREQGLRLAAGHPIPPAAGTRAPDKSVRLRIRTSDRRTRSVCRKLLRRPATPDAPPKHPRTGTPPPTPPRPVVRLHLPRPRPIHGPEIRIRHDDLVAQPLELLRDPLLSVLLSTSTRRPTPAPRTRPPSRPASSQSAARAPPRPSSPSIRIWLCRLCRSMAP